MQSIYERVHARSERFAGLPGILGLRSGLYPSSDALATTRVGLVIVIILLGWMFTQSDSYWEAISRGISGIACVIVFAQLLRSGRPFISGELRIASEKSSATLTLTSGRFQLIQWSAIALLIAWGLAAVAIVVLAYQADSVAFSLFDVPRSVFFAISGAIFAIGYSWFLLRQESEVRTGIHLGPDEIVFAGEGFVQRVQWTDLYRATVQMRKYAGPFLVVLNHRHQKAASISVRSFASDPMLAAALIHYFRDRPEQRPFLADPERAISQFSGHLERMATSQREQG